MSTYTEGNRDYGFLVTEEEGGHTRETVTLKSGQVYAAGAVLGKIVGAATSAANAGNTGTGAMGAITVDGNAKEGAYRVVFIEPGSNAGTFLVEDPDGINIGQGTVAVLFDKGGLSFTIADATDFVSGDGFVITVAAGTKYTLVDKDATDGSQVAAAINLARVDATSADTKGAVLFRGPAQVLTQLLDFGDLTSPMIVAAKAALAKKNIIVREAIA